MTTHAQALYGPNPAMLSWAREEAGLSVPEAAKLLKLRATSGYSPAERLERFESGEAEASESLLEKMCDVYKRPLTLFYLNAPPRESTVGHDFRTMPGREVTPAETGRLKALLRDISARQEYLRDVIEQYGNRSPLTFVGSVTVGTPPTEVAGTIRKLLGDSPSDGIWHQVKSPKSLFNELRSRVEQVGVFVLLTKDSGPVDKRLNEQVFRGFAIADDLAPLIVINGEDATEAQSFTLIHEFTHLLLDETGVSNHPSIAPPQGRRDTVERFCNDVAAEFLVPTQSLEELDAVCGLTSTAKATDASTDAAIDAVAKVRYVSRAMASYRLQRANIISKRTYGSVVKRARDAFHDRRRHQSKRTASATKRSKPEPSQKRTDATMQDKLDALDYSARSSSPQRRLLGDAFTDLVQSVLGEGKISYTDAAFLLGTPTGMVNEI